MTFAETFFKALVNEWIFQQKRIASFQGSAEFLSGYEIGLAFIDLAVEANKVESTEIVIEKVRAAIKKRRFYHDDEELGAYAAIQDLECFLKRAIE